MFSWSCVSLVVNHISKHVYAHVTIMTSIVSLDIYTLLYKKKATTKWRFHEVGRHPTLRLFPSVVLMIVVVVQADVVIPNLGTVTGKIVDFKEDNFIGVDTEIHAFLVR